MEVSDLPNLKAAPLIAFDLETYDPNLLDKGPGGARGDGHVLGYAIAVDGWKAYIPLRHPEGNMENGPARRWLKDTLGTTQDKVGHNVLYDAEWTQADGLHVGGNLYDTGIAEFLLDEERKKYSLETLGQAYFGEGKDESGLADHVRLAMGKPLSYLPNPQEIKANLWRLPAKYVSAYAEQDADLTRRIFEQQIPQLHKEELWPVFMLETQVLQCLLAMRFRGIPVDLDRAARVRDEIRVKAKEAQRQLFSLAGGEINPRSAPEIQAVCDRLGLAYPHTEKGNPSFTTPWMNTQAHPFFKALISVKQLENAADNHVQENIINFSTGGKIFPSFPSVRMEQEGTENKAGTKKGRFASSKPNVAQIPSRNPYLGPLIRSCYVPEPGQQWLSADWSQQEPRLTVHYASLCGFEGAAAFRDRYREKPNTDMHDLTAELAVIERKLAKTINLGLSYGMGAAKLAAQLGLTQSDAQDLMKRYNNALPFIRLLGDRCSAIARDRGFIRTIAGRKNRFNVYGPQKYTPGILPLRKDEAIREWGAVRAWGLHKALNNLVQGSGADMIKKAMVECHAAGLTPLNTIYDELDFSIDGERQARDIREIMLNVYKLEVPLKVDLDMGPSWGEAKELLI